MTVQLSVLYNIACTVVEVILSGIQIMLLYEFSIVALLLT